MKKYRVNICRTAYSNLDITVKAESQEDAMQIAEEEAGNHVFPNEHTSEYDAQGAVEVGPEEDT